MILRQRHQSRTVRRAAVEVGIDGALLLVADVDLATGRVAREVRRREVRVPAPSERVARSLRAEAREFGAAEEVVYGRGPYAARRRWRRDTSIEDEAAMLWATASSAARTTRASSSGRSRASHTRGASLVVGCVHVGDGWRLVAVAPRRSSLSAASRPPVLARPHEEAKDEEASSASSKEAEPRKSSLLFRTAACGAAAPPRLAKFGSTWLETYVSAPVAEARATGVLSDVPAALLALAAADPDDIALVADTAALRDALDAAGFFHGDSGSIDVADLERLLSRARAASLADGGAKRRRRRRRRAAAEDNAEDDDDDDDDLVVQLELLLAFARAVAAASASTAEDDAPRDTTLSLRGVPAFGHCSAVLAADALFYKGRSFWSSWGTFFPTW